MKRPFRQFLRGWALATMCAFAQGQPTVQAQVEQFLQNHPDLQGQRFRVEWPRQVPRLPTCPTPLGLSLGSGVKPRGWVALSVHCAGAWERGLQIRVHAWQRYLAAARNLMPGQSLSPDDLVWAEGESTQLGEQVAQDLLVVGQELRRPLSKGSPVRLNSLRPVTVIKQGSKMVLLLRGPGFEIEAEGQALDNAPLGGTVRVLVKEGTIIPAKVTAAGVAEAQ